MSRLARNDPVNIILRGVVNWQRRRGLNLSLTGVPVKGGVMTGIFFACVLRRPGRQASHTMKLILALAVFTPGFTMLGAFSAPNS
jgi:hypothetical protein